MHEARARLLLRSHPQQTKLSTLSKSQWHSLRAVQMDTDPFDECMSILFLICRQNPEDVVEVKLVISVHCLGLLASSSIPRVEFSIRPGARIRINDPARHVAQSAIHISSESFVYAVFS